MKYLSEDTETSVKWTSAVRWSNHCAAVKSMTEIVDECVPIEPLSYPVTRLCHERYTTRSFVRYLRFHILILPLIKCYALKEVKFTQQYLQTKGFPLNKIVTKIETIGIIFFNRRAGI